MRLALQRSQRRHQRCFGHAFGERQLAAIASVERSQPLGKRASSNSRSSDSGRRRRMSRRNGESEGRAKEILAAVSERAAARPIAGVALGQPLQISAEHGLRLPSWLSGASATGVQAAASRLSRPLAVPLWLIRAFQPPSRSGKPCTTIRPGIRRPCKFEPPAMELHHRLGKAEAQPRSRLRAAFSSRTKRSVDPLAVGSSGMPGPLSATDSTIAPSCRDKSDLDRGLLRRRPPNI